jgi:hypothetical protein
LPGSLQLRSTAKMPVYWLTRDGISEQTAN